MIKSRVKMSRLKACIHCSDPISVFVVYSCSDSVIFTVISTILFSFFRFSTRQACVIRITGQTVSNVFVSIDEKRESILPTYWSIYLDMILQIILAFWLVLTYDQSIGGLYRQNKLILCCRASQFYKNHTWLQNVERRYDIFTPSVMYSSLLISRRQ